MAVHEERFNRFEDIATVLPPEVSGRLSVLIPLSAPVQCITYEYGEEICHNGRFTFPEEIQPFNAQTPLAFVASGCVEIADEVVAPRSQGTVAYSPIRIAYPGEVLGDIAVLDALCRVRSVHWAAEESWKMFAGLSSITSIDSFDREALCDFLHHSRQSLPDESNFDVILRLGLKWFNGREDAQHYTTRLIFLDPKLVCANNSLRDEVSQGGWRNVWRYRACFHAFNYRWLVAYRMRAAGLAETLRTSYRNKKRSTSHFGPKPLNDVAIPEMLFDAINRPLRGELVFTSANTLDREVLQALLPLADLEELTRAAGLDEGTKRLLIPAMFDEMAPERFCFPVDESNYFLYHWINAYSQGLADLKHQSDGVWEPFKGERKFLRRILQKLLDDEGLYKIMHGSAAERREAGRKGLRCRLVDYGSSRLFCEYFWGKLPR